jgi:UDP-N-acetylmuramoylalanine--D-glutamate ligase
LRQRVVILGAGESGTGAAILAKQLGHDAFVSDFGIIKPAYELELKTAQIPFEQNTHTQDLILNADLLVVSPGIPSDAPIVKAAATKNIEILSEIEFGARNSSAKLIGITGTNGKTTTTLLTYHILKNAGLDVGLAGNIGKSLCRKIAEGDHEYYVLELSSFQLDGMSKAKMSHAVLLNITPDHLDRYNSFDDYVKSKFRITQNQTEADQFIYNADDEVIGKHIQSNQIKASQTTFSLQQMSEGGWVEDDSINIKLKNSNQIFKMELNQLTISGKHNTYNSMAAAIIAQSLNIRNDVIRNSLMDFKNIEHRLEFVAKVKGVDYINDSKATNVNSTWYALESMKKDVVWIAGGVDKGNDYSLIEELVKNRVRVLICMGKDNMKLHEAFGDKVDMIINASSAEEATTLASHFAQKGEAVLLSPACASFDLFENYEERGQLFKMAVRNL